MTKYCIAVLFLFLSVLETAGGAGEGTTSFDFLKIGFGAKPKAMGSAYTAYSDDIYALYWNPANISEISGHNFHLGYFNYIMDVQFGFPAFILHSEKYGNFGIAVCYNNGGEFKEIDEFRREISTFSYHSTAFCITTARKINSQFKAGVTLKGVDSRAFNLSMNGIGMDLGFKYKPRFRGLTTAFVIKDFGYVTNGFAGQKINSDFPFPLEYKLGMAYKFKDLKKLLMTVDFVKPQWGLWDLRLGIDYTFDRIVSVRLGQRMNENRFRYLMDKIKGENVLFVAQDANSWSAGLGLRFRRYTLDCALLKTNFAPSPLIFEFSLIGRI